jgi:hypothetical protein
LGLGPRRHRDGRLTCHPFGSLSPPRRNALKSRALIPPSERRRLWARHRVRLSRPRLERRSARSEPVRLGGWRNSLPKAGLQSGRATANFDLAGSLGCHLSAAP